MERDAVRMVYYEEGNDGKTKNKQVEITRSMSEDYILNSQQMSQKKDLYSQIRPLPIDSRYSRRSNRLKRRHIPANPNKTLGIFGFQKHTTEEDVEKLLREKLPEISGYTFKLINDDILGVCRGFCFVEFRCLEDAASAKEVLNFESFRGQDLKCDFSYKRRDGSPYC